MEALTFILFFTTGALPGKTTASPPAWAIFSKADLLNLWAVILSFFVNSPSPSTFSLIVTALGEILRLERLDGDFFADFETLFQIAEVDDGDDIGEFIVETAFGNAAHHRHLAAFEAALRGGAGTRALALGAAAGRLAVAGAYAAADALAAFVRLDAAVDFMQIHVSETPRSRSTSPFERNCSRAFIVALTRLIGLVEP